MVCNHLKAHIRALFADIVIQRREQQQWGLFAVCTVQMCCMETFLPKLFSSNVRQKAKHGTRQSFRDQHAMEHWR